MAFCSSRKRRCGIQQLFVPNRADNVRGTEPKAAPRRMDQSGDALYQLCKFPDRIGTSRRVHESRSGDPRNVPWPVGKRACFCAERCRRTEKAGLSWRSGEAEFAGHTGIEGWVDPGYPAAQGWIDPGDAAVPGQMPGTPLCREGKPSLKASLEGVVCRADWSRSVRASRGTIGVIRHLARAHDALLLDGGLRIEAGPCWPNFNANPPRDHPGRCMPREISAPARTMRCRETADDASMPGNACPAFSLTKLN